MEEEPATRAAEGGGTATWVPPKRPGRVRVFLKRRRAQALRLRRPQPAPEPPVPDGWSTGPPDFVGVGAQRAGTSRWYQLMSLHPRVHPQPVKEIHFFDRLELGSPGHADPAASYERHFPRPPGAVTGEWTPCYMASIGAMGALRRAAPDAKLLVSLRDPVDRFVSGLARLGRRRRETGAPVGHEEIFNAATRGLYAAQLDEVLAEFPREQVLVLQYERCLGDPERELARTWAFLGLEPVTLPPGETSRRVNHAGEHPRLGEDVATSLVRLLAADIERLPEIVPEIDVSLWTSWSTALAMVERGG